MITSVHNPKVQAIRKLQTQAKARREGQAFVIEGVRLAEEALGELEAAMAEIRSILIELGDEVGSE